MLLVLMSFEKCFAVYFPLKSKTVCTVKTAKLATGIVAFILTGYNITSFFFKKSQIDEITGVKKCVLDFDFWNIYLFYFSFDSVLYSFGPFTLMFATNFAIALKFMRAKCRKSLNSLTESTDQALAKSATRGTAMVVTVSKTFLILTAPAGVSDILDSKILLWQIPEYGIFMNITTYLNHSINGILYCLVGSRFRWELAKLFCRNEIPRNASNYNSISTYSTTLSNLNQAGSVFPQ